MIGFLCIGMPAFVWVFLKNKLTEKEYDFKALSVLYFIGLLVINFLMLCVLVFGFQNTENLFENLNYYNLFALKYLALALTMAIGGALFEWCICNKKVKLVFSNKKTSPLKWRCIASAYTLFLAGLTFIRIFDEVFWEDEAFSIRLFPTDFLTIIDVTAADVHPPLYYMIARVVCEIFGYSGSIYRLASYIPYAIILLITMTVIWKWFGKEVSIILVTMASMLASALRYNVEVRMYSWGAVFVFVSFLALYNILKEGKKSGWIVFVISSLAAAYTHYYCLISVAFFYVVLILDTLLRKKENIWRMILACMITVVAYLPWLIILLQTLRRTSENYWIPEQPTLMACLEFLFDSEFSKVLVVLFIVSFILWLMKEFKVFRLSEAPNKTLLIDLSEKQVTDEFVWVIAGVLSIIGTIAVGIGISVFLRPMFIVRYLYPVSIIAWLLLAVFVSRLRFKLLCAGAILIMVLHSGMPEWYEGYLWDEYRNEIQADTLSCTVDEISKEDYILTNSAQIDWTIADIYYPGVKHSIFALNELPVLERDVEYWFILNEKPEDSFFEELNENGYTSNMVVEQGYLGTISVWIYRVSFQN